MFEINTLCVHAVIFYIVEPLVSSLVLFYPLCVAVYAGIICNKGTIGLIASLSVLFLHCVYSFFLSLYILSREQCMSELSMLHYTCQVFGGLSRERASRLGWATRWMPHSECVRGRPARGSCLHRFRPVFSCSSLPLSDSSALVYHGSAAAKARRGCWAGRNGAPALP